MYVNKDLPSHLGGHDNETHLDDGVLDYMMKKYSIKSYIDIGCGPGGMCELAASKGLKVLGIDGDYTLTHKEPTLIHDFTNGSASVEDIFDMALRYGITYPGRKPTNPAAIEARERDIREKIAKIDAERGVAAKK
jgi:hypothetical protein